MLPRRQTFLYLSLLICVWSVLADHKLFGFHSDELDSGHLVVPRRVDANGEFVSFNLRHNHQQDYQRQRKRSHSEAEEEHSRGKRAVADGPHELHYQLEVNDETLHLELEPHSYFMTPNLIIERHRRDLRTRAPPRNHTNCHFHGRVRGQSESRVALSTCTGLVGHIKTNQHEYYIEPSKYHEAHATNGHPHVVFHGSAVRDKASRHKAKRKRKQKKKHHQHQHTQRHHRQRQRQQMAANSAAAVSNCGTKEPRRRLETRLEWQRQGKVKIQGGRKVRRHFGRQQHEPMTAQEHTKFKYRTTPEEVTNETVYGSYKNKYNNNYNNNGNNSDNDNENIDQRIPATTATTTTTTTTTPMKPSSSSSAASSVSAAEAPFSLSMASGNGEPPLRRRRRRSISSPRHVATLIVADATMVGFHNDQLETYLLTIMNMVSSLYKDPSIGNSIEIVVVKIVLLEEDAAHPDMNLTQNAQRNLDTFCSWQHKLNTGHDRDAHHHDVAILITRKNICGNNCMTLGLANVGGMCKPKQSCSVNEDNGIMLSHTIAHELGHNFGMFHDTAKIGCHPRVGSIVHIMTPTFGADTLHVSWSNCSRKYITHFLDQGLGDCLDDAPAPLDVYNYPERPPGVLFNAELQCRLQFNISADTDVGTCSSMHEICSTLWCKVNGECVTNMRPTAPGTSCGKRKWCQNGECVRMAEITPIDGGWGNWSEWSECSRSCGGGVSIQQRECDNPLPSNGGIFCLGQRKRYKICNKKPCPPGEPSFRAQQCSNYDNVPYQGEKYKWLPFFDKKNPCKLFCSDVDDTIIANWGDVVLNGTPCTLGTNNMCIDGICKKVGCDWVVDSDKQEDRCGICGGAGDQCKQVRETFKEAMNVSEGYVEIVTIPARARNIVIKELDGSMNFLGVAKAGSSKFYLNGDSLISMPGEYIIAGAESLYDRVDDRETITIPQPLEHSIALYVIVRSREPYKGIYYEFTLPALNVSSSRHYSWKLGDWTECSASCGGGWQYREPLCYENGKLTSNEILCYVSGSNPRPRRRRRPCNESPCPAHWLVGPWQFCPVTCTPVDGPYPFRRRSVMCLGQNEIVVDDLNCDEATRPSETEPCELNMPVCKAAVAVAKTGGVLRRGRQL